MVEVRCRPIDTWNGPRTPRHERRAAPFSASWGRVVLDLQRELQHLDARDVTIGISAMAHQIRVDGWPKANASIDDPVSLTFDSRHGPLRYECDRWSHWRQNVRAIGLTLQRLRLVDEGGVARSGEQYRGWGALPPGDPIAVGAAMTVDEAARFLALHGHTIHDGHRPLVGDVIGDPTMIEHLHRRAAKRLHPDAGGDPEMFRRLTQARDLLLREGNRG